MIGGERGGDVRRSWSVVFWSWGMVGGFGGMVCRCRGLVLGSRSMVFWGSWVVSLSLIGDIGNKSVVPIGVVGDVLDPSIR